MENPRAPHRSPSVGATVKKVLDINPDLTMPEIIALIRQGTRARGAEAGEYADVEVIDEARVLELARATLGK